jgi:hypothetical protein
MAYLSAPPVNNDYNNDGDDDDNDDDGNNNNGLRSGEWICLHPLQRHVMRVK